MTYTKQSLCATALHKMLNNISVTFKPEAIEEYIKNDIDVTGEHIIESIHKNETVYLNGQYGYIDICITELNL